MRELEFLPDWYPQIRRRKRLVILQGWMTLTLAIGLSMWMVLAQRNVRAAQRTLDHVDAQLTESRSDLKAVDELLVLDTQLGQQEEVLARVGPHVDAARLIATLDEVMPSDMAVLDLSVDTEQPVAPAAVTSLAGAKAVQKQTISPPRRVRVKLIGVAPTDVDIANFLTNLTKKPVFDSISMTRSRERPENGHVMREFEVTFGMELQDLIGG